MRDITSKHYQELYKDAKLLTKWSNDLKWITDRLLRNQKQYTGFETPWGLIACIHALESGCDMTKQILNGESWSKRTLLVPKGLGPWASWTASTEYALKHGDFPSNGICTLPVALAFMEHWNGFGYAKRGIESPYIWSGTLVGVGVGKFVADGKYDPIAVSKQVGAAAIFKSLEGLGYDLGFANEGKENG